MRAVSCALRLRSQLVVVVVLGTRMRNVSIIDFRVVLFFLRKEHRHAPPEVSRGAPPRDCSRHFPIELVRCCCCWLVARHKILSHSFVPNSRTQLNALERWSKQYTFASSPIANGIKCPILTQGSKTRLVSHVSCTDELLAWTHKCD